MGMVLHSLRVRVSAAGGRAYSDGLDRWQDAGLCSMGDRRSAVSPIETAAKGLDLAALWERADEKARHEAERMYPPHMIREREQAQARLALQYYRQMANR